MKKFGIVMALLMSFLFVSAQQSGAAQRGEKQQKDGSSLVLRQQQELAQLTKQLSLTPEQKTSIVALQDKLNEAVRVSREATKDDPARNEKRKALRGLRKSYEADVMALLTASQKKKYEAILLARREQAQNQGERQGAAQSQRMGDSSGGSDDSGE